MNAFKLIQLAHDLGETVTLWHNPDPGWDCDARVGGFNGTGFAVIEGKAFHSSLLGVVNANPSQWACEDGRNMRFAYPGREDYDTYASLPDSLRWGSMPTREVREMAIRMAIGNTRTNGWKNIGEQYKDPIGPLFLALTPAEQAVVRAWEVILSAAPEPLTCDGYDISRRGTDTIAAMGDAAPLVPAAVAGFLSYVSREMSWELPAKIHAILYPELVALTAEQRREAASAWKFRGSDPTPAPVPEPCVLDNDSMRKLLVRALPWLESAHAVAQRPEDDEELDALISSIYSHAPMGSQTTPDPEPEPSMQELVIYALRQAEPSRYAEADECSRFDVVVEELRKVGVISPEQERDFWEHRNKP
jgi:hypothetical protein